MNIIELDLTDCKTPFDLHERIRMAFHFPTAYGKNWSAFWDLLWSECDADKVIIRGENGLSTEFDNYITKLHEILERNVTFHSENNLNAFSYEIID
ncbi:MAG: hypothetical protein E7552_02765 [Ruminococcaceae bacterium]|nr:hypothetical protein [Oscillospiraceae bacterium]